MKLEGNTKHLALEFTNRAYLVDEKDNYAGVRFRIDPRFFLADFNAGVAWTQLRAAAAHRFVSAFLQFGVLAVASASPPGCLPRLLSHLRFMQRPPPLLPPAFCNGRRPGCRPSPLCVPSELPPCGSLFAVPLSCTAW